MSKATEALSIVDALAEGRYDRWLLSIHLATVERMRVLGTTVREETLRQFEEREKVRESST